MKLKTIGIDARFYGPVGKGLGRYTQEIVDGLIKLDQENQYIIFLSPENFAQFKLPNERISKVLIKARWYSLAEQIVLPFLIWQKKIDLMFFPHFNVPAFCPTRFLVTIHDLILTKFPTQHASTLNYFFYTLKNWGYKLIIWLAIKRSQAILTVSEFTCSDILTQFKVKSEKVKVIYEGVANLNLVNLKILSSDVVLKKYNIQKPFLLYVGNVYPHKNLEKFIDSFSRLISQKEYQNLKLVLVGKHDYFYNRLKNFAFEKQLYSENNKNNKVIFTGFVPDNELNILFQEALTYVFPSLYEGFGLPPLEAMAQGCPVISSNQASMPEILGEAAFYFNPSSLEETQKSVIEIIKNENLRHLLIQKGREQVKKYSWDRCANETFEIIKTSLGEK